MTTYFRNYDDWREQLAVKILTPIITGAIQQQQQRDANRKYNAAQGELARRIEDATLPQIGQPQMPETNNGWVNALHQGGNELANFDANTANLLPPSMQTSQPVTWPQQKTLTMDEIRNIANNLFATKRFSAMNPADVQAILKPHLDAAERAQKEQRQKDLVNTLTSTANTGDMYRQAVGGAVQELIPDFLLRSIQEQYKYENPHYLFSTVDAGDKKYTLRQNPFTGDEKQINSYNVGVSPNTNATIGMHKYITDTDAVTERTKNNQNYNINDRKVKIAEEDAIYNRENPELGQITDENGAVFFYDKRNPSNVVQLLTPDGKKITARKDLSRYKIVQNQDGEYVVVDPFAPAGYPIEYPNGEPVKGTAKNSTTQNRDMTKSEELRYSTLDTELKELRKQREKAYHDMNTWMDEQDSPEYKAASADIVRIDAEIERIKKDMNEIASGARRQTQATSQRQPVKGTNGKTIAFYNHKTKESISQEVWEQAVQDADNGKFKAYGINSSEDLVKYYVNQGYTDYRVNPTKTQPASRDIRTSQVSSTDKMSQTVSSGVTNQTSADVQPPQSTLANISQDKTATAPAPRKPGDKIKVNLPDAMFYNPERDKDTPPEKIYSMNKFKEWFSSMLVDPKMNNLTPEQILQKVFDNGFRVKKG